MGVKIPAEIPSRTSRFIKTFGVSCRLFQKQMILANELFYTLQEAQIMAERWRKHYDTVRPHSSLGSQPPAPEPIQLAS